MLSALAQVLNTRKRTFRFEGLAAGHEWVLFLNCLWQCTGVSYASGLN